MPNGHFDHKPGVFSKDVNDRISVDVFAKQSSVPLVTKYTLSQTCN